MSLCDSISGLLGVLMLIIPIIYIGVLIIFVLMNKKGLRKITIFAFIILIFLWFLSLGVELSDICAKNTYYPPYCGYDYCIGRTNQTNITNCTCIQY